MAPTQAGRVIQVAARLWRPACQCSGIRLCIAAPLVGASAHAELHRVSRDQGTLALALLDSWLGRPILLRVVRDGLRPDRRLPTSAGRFGRRGSSPIAGGGARPHAGPLLIRAARGLRRGDPAAGEGGHTVGQPNPDSTPVARQGDGDSRAALVKSA